MGLRKWVGEKWVDIANKKADGSYPKCGRSGGEKRKNYPKCVPLAKARSMSRGQKASAVRRKQAEKIKLDVINWSKTVLEPMNKHIGFPACPFAAKWRKDNKVRIEVRMDKSKYEKQLTDVIKSWNKKQHDIIIYCDPFFEQYTPEQFQDKIDFYNKTYNRRDVYFMGFHPETPADPDSEAFLCDPTEEPVEHSGLEYSMMLIQKFKQLYEASCKLHKIGYYEKWPKEYYEEVVAERQRTYEQLNKKR